MNDKLQHPVFRTKVTVFENSFSDAAGTMALGQWLFAGRNRELAERYRSLTTDEDRAKEKRKLPCATLNAVFEKHRRRDEPHTLTGLMCVDVDAKDNPGFTPAALKQTLAKSPFALYVGHSISGKGVFMVVRVKAATDEEFSRQYEAFLNVLIDDFGIFADKQCKDVTRLRALSFDDKPFVNPDAPAFHKTQKPAQKKTVQRTYFATNDQTNAKVNAAVELWEQRGLIFSGHDEYYELAASLKDVPNGLELFERLCASYPYRHKISTRYQFGKAKDMQHINVNTFFFIMARYGISNKEIFDRARFRFPDAFPVNDKANYHGEQKTPSEAAKTNDTTIQAAPATHEPAAATTPATTSAMATTSEAAAPPDRAANVNEIPPPATRAPFRYNPGTWQEEEALFRADPAHYPPGAPDDPTTKEWWEFLAERKRNK